MLMLISTQLRSSYPSDTRPAYSSQRTNSKNREIPQMKNAQPKLSATPSFIYTTIRFGQKTVLHSKLRLPSDPHAPPTPPPTRTTKKDNN